MTKEEMFIAFGNIDDRFILIEQTDKVKKRMPIWKIAAYVACACLAAVTTVIATSRAAYADSNRVSTVDTAINAPITVTDVPVSDSLQYLPIISSYGSADVPYDMAVNNGCYVLSDSLKAAIEEYGINVLYRVNITLFSDGIQKDQKGDILTHESERLTEEGYTVAIEKYNDGYVDYNYFTLHASASQLTDFTADPNFGYYISFYGGFNDTVVNNDVNG